MWVSSQNHDCCVESKGAKMTDAATELKVTAASDIEVDREALDPFDP